MKTTYTSRKSVVVAIAAKKRRQDAAVAARRRAAVEEVARAGREWLTRRASSIHEALAERVHTYDRVGAPPSLFTLMGLSDYEKPYNRVLGWILDPEAEHGAGRIVLRHLAERLDLPLLVEDLLNPDGIVEIRSERMWPQEVEDSRMPDLLILSDQVALLIENKVHAPESGPDQYADYLDTLERLAELRGLESSAWLAAPTKRTTPQSSDGERTWDDTIRHDELADCIEEAAADEALSAWGRVLCLLVAEQLRHDHHPARWLAEARALLRDDRQGLRDVTRLGQMQRLLNKLDQPTPPWPTGEDR